jgi:signal transduction histidine kinase
VGVGLALLAEVCLVSTLTLAPTPVEAGIPAVVAAAIAGTVAVVFGALDGIALAFLGAVLFGVIDGWTVGAFAALIVWPGVVGAVGLFARRVEQQRDLLRELVGEQEAERRRAALAIYDEKAQVLSGALLMLRAAGHGEGETAAAAAAQARELIGDTITELRVIAGDLSPRALEQQGLATALEQLADTMTRTTDATIEVEATGDARLSLESELALYRFIDDVLASLIDAGEQRIRVALSSHRRTVTVSISADGSPGATQGTSKVHHERLRLLGGHIHISRTQTGTLIHATVPAEA